MNNSEKVQEGSDLGDVESTVRVGLVVDLHEPSEINLCVSLSSRKTGMTEHFLDGPQICPSLKQMGRE